MDTTGMINVNKCDLIKMIKTAYDFSQPVGMGFLKYKPEPLTDEQAAQYINELPENKDGEIVSLDYVLGRCCKFNIYRINGELWISDRWYDHDTKQLKDLILATTIAS